MWRSVISPPSGDFSRTSASGRDERYLFYLFLHEPYRPAFEWAGAESRIRFQRARGSRRVHRRRQIRNLVEWTGPILFGRTGNERISLGRLGGCFKPGCRCPKRRESPAHESPHAVALMSEFLRGVSADWNREGLSGSFGWVDGEFGVFRRSNGSMGSHTQTRVSLTLVVRLAPVHLGQDQAGVNTIAVLQRNVY